MRKRRTRRINSIRTFGIDGTEAAPETTDFDAAVDAFIRHCRVKNLTDTTIQYYRDVLHILIKTLADTCAVTRPCDVERDHINSCILAKQNEELSDATINSYIRGWRAFFRWLRKEGYITSDVGDKIKNIKAEKRMLQTFSREQIRQLLSAPDRLTFTGYRDYVIMLLLLDTGARIAEVAEIKLPDIDWRERMILLYGKGRKERRVPMQKTLEKHLREYIKIRGLLDTDHVFVTIDNTPLTPRQMQLRIKEHGLTAGIRGVRVSPHTFRHTFAKYYIMNGGDVFSLQKILGHSTLDMCKVYVSMFGTDVAAQHRKYSPLERL